MWKITEGPLVSINIFVLYNIFSDLIYDLCLAGKEGFEKVLDIFPPNYKQANRRLQVPFQSVYRAVVSKNYPVSIKARPYKNVFKYDRS